MTGHTEPDKTRQLSASQEAAIALLLQGKTDGDVTEAVGVTRQTIWIWRHRHPAFVAEVNLRRREVWEAVIERLRGMLTPAVEALADGLKANDARLRLAAAVHVLRAMGVYGEGRGRYEPVAGPTTPEAVEQAQAEAESWRKSWEPLLRTPNLSQLSREG